MKWFFLAPGVSPGGGRDKNIFDIFSVLKKLGYRRAKPVEAYLQTWAAKICGGPKQIY